MHAVTWNIRHGAGLDGRVDLERTATTIRSLGADVIGLQEVDRGWARSGDTDQPRLLEDLLGMEVVFGATVVRDGGEYGLAIATAGSVTTEVERLPGAEGEEPRAAIVARTHGITVLVTHLSRHARSRRVQIEHLAHLARAARPPVVLLGDLNEGRRGLRPLRRVGLGAPRRRIRTAPSHRPVRQIDHVLAGRGALVERVWAVSSGASDHRPLVAAISVAEDHH